MCRAAILIIALAAMATPGARGLQTTKTHRKTVSPTRSAHAATHSPAAAVGARRPAPRTSSATRHSSYTGPMARNAGRSRESASEVGFRAGLAIRNQRRGLRTRAVLRKVQLHRTYPARTRTISDAPLDATADDQPAESAQEAQTNAGGAADEVPYNRIPPGQAVPSRIPADRATRTLEDAAASVAASQAQQAGESAHSSAYQGQAFDVASAPAPSADADAAADNGASPVERITPSVVARANASGAVGAALAQEDEKDSSSPPPTEAASVRTETEEATLAIPHSLMPSPLRGSLESLERQNAKLDAEGLERIEDENDLAMRIADGLLVPVPASAALTVNSDLLPNHRYCRPWTARFLADLAREHEAVFHKPIQVSSAVRTVEYQRRLMHINGNAAPAEGDVVSPHLTGATVDIAKSGLSRQEMAWMRQRLLALESAGKIDVEEEFRQACFHITVYRNYAPEHKTQPNHRVAPSTEDDAGAQGL
jgi:Family of unknown function (DUF5715)